MITENYNKMKYLKGKVLLWELRNSLLWNIVF